MVAKKKCISKLQLHLERRACEDIFLSGMEREYNVNHIKDQKQRTIDEATNRRVYTKTYLVRTVSGLTIAVTLQWFNPIYP